MKYRIQATETGYETVAATSTVRSFGPGQRIKPQDESASNTIDQQVVLGPVVAHERFDGRRVAARLRLDASSPARP